VSRDFSSGVAPLSYENWLLIRCYFYRNVMYDSPVQIVSSEISSLKTFMDTLGRTTLKLTAMNVIDEARDKDLIITYDYPFTAAYRKPITIFAGIMAVFLTAWSIGRLDVSIAKPS